MKHCFKCGERKPLAEFYRHPMTADGHLNKCKECAKQDVTKNRWKNVEAVRDYDRKRKRKEGLTEDQWAVLSEKQRAQSESYKRRYPKKYAAHVVVGNALRDGKLIQLPCEVCGSEKVHAHHCDYSRPLEVMWLCAIHHSEWHRRNGEGLNG